MNLIFKKITRWQNPRDVFASLYSHEKHAFWLDRRSENMQHTYMGIADAVIEYSLQSKKTLLTKGDNKQIFDKDIFNFLNEELSKKEIDKQADVPFDFNGGYVGYFGYELKSLTGGKSKYTSATPDSIWFFVKQFLVFDHVHNLIYLASLTEDQEQHVPWFNEIENKLHTHISKYRKAKPEPKSTITFTPNITKANYLVKIEEAKKYLKRGESYEICLTNTFTTKAEIDAFALFDTISNYNRSPYLTYLKHNNLAIISSTPEQFITINKERTIISKPIKGTIARAKHPAEDEKQKKKLLTSEKDLAENLMITDLLRNDLGKVCEIGSVNVPKLQAIESYQTVHQMVSTISGKLRTDVSLIESIKTCFPGGSMTGAPKIRTMEILDELETQARGIYSGALGYLSLDQTASLNIVIRTVVINGNNISIGAGGAILYQSDDNNEYEEMLLKAQVLLQSITATVNAEKFKIADDTSHKVFIALGSNVGDKRKNIKLAISKLREEISEITVAPFYESKPMYYEEQDVFINTVLVGQTHLTPQELLAFCKETEKSLGRKMRFRNGPREIDIDILFYDDLILRTDNLIIPHPLLQERDFVLVPITKLDPQFIHPLLKQSMQSLRNAI